jgi:competence ComEA-like helix-hairpin-helix protein
MIFNFSKNEKIVIVFLVLLMCGGVCFKLIKYSFSNNDFAARYEEKFSEFERKLKESDGAKAIANIPAETPNLLITLIDINSATKEDLEKLPYIGPTLAQRIINFRRDRGGFKSLADLNRVKGIGEKLLKKISPYLCCRNNNNL